MNKNGENHKRRREKSLTKKYLAVQGWWERNKSRFVVSTKDNENWRDSYPWSDWSAWRDKKGW